MKAAHKAVGNYTETADKVYDTIIPGCSGAFEAHKGNYLSAVVLLFLDFGTVGKGEVAKESIEEGEKYLFRAVSKKELDDIAKYGLRVDPKTGYSLGKLFAKTLDKAVEFGKELFQRDKSVGRETKEIFIIRAKIPDKVLDKSTKFIADSKNAVSGSC